MRMVIMLILIAIIMIFIAGCGPGQPFEIEGRLTSQTATPAHIIAVR